MGPTKIIDLIHITKWFFGIGKFQMVGDLAGDNILNLIKAEYGRTVGQDDGGNGRI